MNHSDIPPQSTVARRREISGLEFFEQMMAGTIGAPRMVSLLGRCAVNTLQPAGRLFTTLELKINYTRPLRREVSEVRCEASVIHAGNRTAIAEAHVLDAAETIFAHGTTTCILVERQERHSTNV